MSRIKKIISSLFSYPQQKILQAPDYDNYWQQKRGENITVLSPFQLNRAKTVASLIRENSYLVDIGCGNCAVLEWIATQSKSKAHGLDCSQFAQASAQQLGIAFSHCDITNHSNLHSVPEADYLLLLEILEHLSTPEQTLISLLPKAKIGIIFSVPNSGYFIHRLRYLFGRMPCQWLTHPAEHLRFWTVADIRWWLNALSIPDFSSQLLFYEGVPFLNKISPSLFAKGIVVMLSRENHS